MPFHRKGKRITRRTIGRSARQLGRTLLTDSVTLDPAVAIIIVEPSENVGTGATVQPDTNADFQKVVATQTLVKYVNIRFQSGLRDVAPSAPGFTEYAIILFDEQTAAPIVPASINTALGTNTLGQLCHTYFRGKCIWEGAFRVSRELPEVVDVKIKIPDKWCLWKRGQYLMCFKAFRTNDVSDTTSDCRTWFSTNFKAYR